MVSITYCDRCRKEISQSNDNLVTDIWSHFDSGETNGFVLAKRPQLCNVCKDQYNDIMKETNIKIDNFLKNKK